MKLSATLLLSSCLATLGGGGGEGATGAPRTPARLPSAAAAVAEARPAPQLESGRNESVKLGLLIPGEGGADGLAALRGAELAIAQANARGGLEGRPFELIVRTQDGPWGSASKKIVSLVFDEGVRAILGSLDGRAAHLAEQVATKGRVALVSPWAFDPSLTRINIPWFFRCAPDDRQQAVVLADEVFRGKRLRRVAALAEATYDAGVAADAFCRTAVDAGYPRPLRLGFAAADVAKRLEDADIEAVVLFGRPLPAAALVRALRENGSGQALFGALSLAHDDFLAAAGRHAEGAVLIAPEHWCDPGARRFCREYRQAHGSWPSAVAAYAFDGMSFILEAIGRAGPDRERIREYLATSAYPDGVTGPVRFDAHGNRLGPLSLVEIRGERPGFLRRISPRAVDSASRSGR